MHVFRGDERAVSPVIGTILILFIIVTAMAGILAWGVPAIQGLQEHAEFQSMLTQAHQLNADLQKLRDTKAASTAVFSMNQGELRVEPGGRWVVTTFVTSDSTWRDNVYFSGWEWSGTIVAKGVPALSTMTMDRATASFTSLTTTSCVVGDCAGAKLDLNITASYNPVIRIQIKQGATLMVESWVFNAGRITYKLDSDSSFNRIHVEMGAVFTQQGSAVFVDRKPAVKEPDYTTSPTDGSFIARAFQIQQNTGTVVTGKGRHTINVNLDDNYGSTRGRPYLETAYATRIQVDDGAAANTKGTLEEGFCSYFDALTYYTPRVACATGNADVLYYPAQAYTYELSQAVVKANVKPL